ncbi:MAG: hypothetical protein ACOCVF_01455 [bacterium]
MVRGYEFHEVIYRVFGDVKNLYKSEQVQVNCPKCQEREYLSEPDGKYNLEINTEKRVFRCWKCEEPKFSGSLGRLIRIYGSKIDYQVYKDYASTYFDYNEHDDKPIDYHVQLPNEMILFANMNNSNKEHLEAYMYMIVDRKLSKEILFKYRIGFCTSGKYMGRIIIPSYDKDGEVNYFVARTYKGIKPSYLNPQFDKDAIIFNEAHVNWDSTIYLVEGSFEFLSFPINTIPLLGKTIGKKLFFELKKRKPYVILVLDPDAYKNAVENFNILSALYIGEEDKIRIVKLKEGEYDLDEINRKLGKEIVIENLKTARKLITDDYFI